MAKETSSTIGEFLLLLLIAAVVLVLAIVLSPIWIPFVIYEAIKEKIEQRKFQRYLEESEGVKFFCYTNRRTSEAYVEANIVPFLPNDVRVLHIMDKYWDNLSDNTEFPVRLVSQMRTVKGGFPYVAKVVNGQLATESINGRLYSAITRKADADNINQRIARFYGPMET